MKTGSKICLFLSLAVVCIRLITSNQAPASPNPCISDASEVNFGSGNNQEKKDKPSRWWKWLLFWWWAVLVGVASPVFVTHAAGDSATAEYSFVASPGWAEGALWWNCTTSNCAIYSFLPGGGGNVWEYWKSGPLPLGHYYWLGTISVLKCSQGKWIEIGRSGYWYFNYDPRNGDQTAVAGGVCGSNIDLDRNLGNPNPCRAQ